MQTKNKSNEDNIRKRETKNETRKDVSEDDYNRKVERNEELQKQVRDYEEADKLIKETTGADDINEICQKYSNLIETKDKLKKEKKDLEKLCDSLGKRKDELMEELKELKIQGQDEITRKELEDNEKTVERTLKSCEESRIKLKRVEKLNVEIFAAINMIIHLLSNKSVYF